MCIREADHIVGLLPERLKAAACFLDRLTARWRYVYGDPFVGLPNDQIVLGCHMYHEVTRLFDVVSCAERRLNTESFARYLDALGNPENHEDALVEFAPILRLNAGVELAHEVPGEGGSTIDWSIRAPGERALLLEVKNRARDLFEGFRQFTEGDDGTTGTSPEPAHDPSILFRSIEQKFPRRQTSEAVQG